MLLIVLRPTISTFVGEPIIKGKQIKYIAIQKNLMLTFIFNCVGVS